MSDRLRRALRRPAQAIALAAVASVAFAPAAQAQYTAYALTTTTGGAQQLVRFNTADPTNVAVVGLVGNVTLTGLDFRPATGMLYGFDGSALYTLNPSTGAATFTFATSAPATGNVGFDFNPTVDRIRIVSPAGTNLRVNPADGVAIVDGAYTYAAGDPNAGQTPSFMAVAYTNSDNDPATGTTLFGVDRNLGTLVRVDAPNGGAVTTIGSLGLGLTPGVTGFDIVTVGTTNVAFLTTLVAGTPASRLYTVNLATGVASRVGTIAAANGVTALAVTTIPEPGTWALLAAGLVGVAGVATTRRRRAR